MVTIPRTGNFRQIISVIENALNSGGGGGSSWGSITGTLSSQTDLQTALNGKQASGSYAASSHAHSIANVTGLQTALDGKSIIKTATANLGVRGVFEHRETISDASVSASSKIVLSLAGSTDGDENDAEMLDLYGMSAIPADGNITVVMSFKEKTSGPIKLNYSIG